MSKGSVSTADRLVPDELWEAIEPLLPEHPPPKERRTATALGSEVPGRDHLCPETRDRMGAPSAGTRLRLGHDLLATAPRVAGGWRLAAASRGDARQAQQRRPAGFLPRDGRRSDRESSERRQKTGPNPTDRRKCGSKRHLLTERRGIPLVVRITGAHRHDVTQLLPLVDAIPAVKGQPGRPRRRPDWLLADRGDDSQKHRGELKARGIHPSIAKRGRPHGSGLGIFRWPVERTHAWFNAFRRLAVRRDRMPELYEAFHSLAAALICLNQLQRFC